VLVLDGGRIVVDEQVTLSRPRSAAYVGFQDLRRTLLGALGVDVRDQAPLDPYAPSL